VESVEAPDLHLSRDAALEDVILAKLEWAKRGGSARQIEDAARLLRVAAGKVDTNYLQRWIDELGVRKEWSVARETAP